MGMFQVETQLPESRGRKRVKQGVPPWLDKKLAKDQLDATRAPAQFVVWDGEGVVHDGDDDMSYVLLGYRDGSETPGTLITGKRLATIECLQFIWDVGTNLSAGYIHVSFGFKFDVDQIMRDAPIETQRTLLDTNECKYGGFTIRYIPRKFFTVTKGKRKGVTIFDTISFFNGSLISACKEYLPGDERIDDVEAGKQGRSSFRFDELDSIIIPYWEREGDLMVSLMSQLRFNMVGAGINLTSWHGPGAIANALITRERIGSHIIRSRVEMPAAVTDATAFAYFGGRFEAPMMGRIPGPIYSYDIRSAYPAALSRCPGLEGGEWVHTMNPKRVDDWGIYRATNHGLIEAHSPADAVLGMGPLPIRADAGNVSFGVTGSGWWFGHEIIAAQLTGWDVYLHEGWEYKGSTDLPFLFLHELYLQRADWKRAGNPSQLAAKLGLNSIYGKLAQLTGWDEIEKLPPKYHQQWYAGQTTSWCRARLWMAISQNPDAVLAVETDGIYTVAPLDLKLSQFLGDWEAEVFDEAIYVQSGVYFMRQGDTWTKAKTRGMGSSSVGVDRVLDALPTLAPIETSVHRYGNMSGYLGRENHYQWFDETRTIVWGGDGKRTHLRECCPQCVEGRGPHRTVMTRPHPGASHPRDLPWITGNVDAWRVDATEHGVVAL
jgi:hypothetical protein